MLHVAVNKMDCSRASPRQGSPNGLDLTTTDKYISNASLLPVVVEMAEHVDLGRNGKLTRGTRLSLLYVTSEPMVQMRDSSGRVFEESTSFDACRFGLLPADRQFDDKMYVTVGAVMEQPAEKRPKRVRCLKSVVLPSGEEIEKDSLFDVGAEVRSKNGHRSAAWTIANKSGSSGEADSEVVLPYATEGRFVALLDPKLYRLNELSEGISDDSFSSPVRVQAVGGKPNGVTPGQKTAPRPKYSVIGVSRGLTLVAIDTLGNTYRIAKQASLAVTELVQSDCPELSASLRVISCFVQHASFKLIRAPADPGSLSGDFNLAPPHRHKSVSLDHSDSTYMEMAEVTGEKQFGQSRTDFGNNRSPLQRTGSVSSNEDVVLPSNGVLTQTRRRISPSRTLSVPVVNGLRTPSPEQALTVERGRVQSMVGRPLPPPPSSPSTLSPGLTKVNRRASSPAPLAWEHGENTNQLHQRKAGSVRRTFSSSAADDLASSRPNIMVRDKLLVGESPSPEEPNVDRLIQTNKDLCEKLQWVERERDAFYNRLQRVRVALDN